MSSYVAGKSTVNGDLSLGTLSKHGRFSIATFDYLKISEKRYGKSTTSSSENNLQLVDFSYLCQLTGGQPDMRLTSLLWRVLCKTPNTIAKKSTRKSWVDDPPPYQYTSMPHKALTLAVFWGVGIPNLRLTHELLIALANRHAPL